MILEQLLTWYLTWELEQTLSIPTQISSGYLKADPLFVVSYFVGPRSWRPQCFVIFCFRTHRYGWGPHRQQVWTESNLDLWEFPVQVNIQLRIIDVLTGWKSYKRNNIDASYCDFIVLDMRSHTFPWTPVCGLACSRSPFAMRLAR